MMHYKRDNRKVKPEQTYKQRQYKLTIRKEHREIVQTTNIINNNRPKRMNIIDTIKKLTASLWLWVTGSAQLDFRLREFKYCRNGLLFSTPKMRLYY